jgi:hypothetical protein
LLLKTVRLGISFLEALIDTKYLRDEIEERSVSLFWETSRYLRCV